MKKLTEAAAKPTDAQKLARVRAAKANLKKAETTLTKAQAALKKAQAVKSKSQTELNAALAAL